MGDSSLEEYHELTVERCHSLLTSASSKPETKVTFKNH